MTSPSQITIADRINSEHASALAAGRSFIEHATNCGRLLLDAKEEVGHGNWMVWVAANLTISARQARKYMQLAMLPGSPNWPREAIMGIDRTLAQSATPKVIESAPKQLDAADKLHNMKAKLDSIEAENNRLRRELFPFSKELLRLVALSYLPNSDEIDPQRLKESIEPKSEVDEIIDESSQYGEGIDWIWDKFDPDSEWVCYLAVLYVERKTGLTASQKLFFVLRAHSHILDEWTYRFVYSIGADDDGLGPFAEAMPRAA